MKIHVTKGDIAKAWAIRKKPVIFAKTPRSYFCPIAQAVRRLRPTAKKISVGTDHLFVDGQQYDLPAVAQQFVKTADRQQDQGLAPFTFTAGPCKKTCPCFPKELKK